MEDFPPPGVLEGVPGQAPLPLEADGLARYSLQGCQCPQIICIGGELATRNINYSLGDKTCLDYMAAVAGVVTHQCRDLKLLKQLAAMWLR